MNVQNLSNQESDKNRSKYIMKVADEGYSIGVTDHKQNTNLRRNLFIESLMKCCKWLKLNLTFLHVQIYNESQNSHKSRIVYNKKQKVRRSWEANKIFKNGHYPVIFLRETSISIIEFRHVYPQICWSCRSFLNTNYSSSYIFLTKNWVEYLSLEVILSWVKANQPKLRTEYFNFDSS